MITDTIARIKLERLPDVPCDLQVPRLFGRWLWRDCQEPAEWIYRVVMHCNHEPSGVRLLCDPCCRAVRYGPWEITCDTCERAAYVRSVERLHPP